VVIPSGRARSRKRPFIQAMVGSPLWEETAGSPRNRRLDTDSQMSGTYLPINTADLWKHQPETRHRPLHNQLVDDAQFLDPTNLENNCGVPILLIDSAFGDFHVVKRRDKPKPFYHRVLPGRLCC